MASLLSTSGVLSVEVYTFIVEKIFDRIEAAGYHHKAAAGTRQSKPCSGFDTSKMTPENLFHLPCLHIDPENSFFIDYSQPVRRAIDAGELIKNWFDESLPVAEQVEGPALSRNAEERNVPAIDSAIHHWRSATQSGQGNQAFHSLALKLKTAGVSDPELDIILHHECRFARSPASVTKRRRQIRSIFRSLKAFGLCDRPQ